MKLSCLHEARLANSHKTKTFERVFIGVKKEFPKVSLNNIAWFCAYQRGEIHRHNNV